MAQDSNRIETKVTLDASQAQQEIAKLNTIAADTTRTYEERLDAKNKQIRLSDDLNKKLIKTLQAEVKALTGVVGKEKELEKTQNKLNKAQLTGVKTSGRLNNQSKKLALGLKGSTGAMNQLNTATGGLISRLQVLLANPIVATLAALAAVASFFVNATKKGAEFGKSLSTLKGISGATGKELETLKEQAKQLGATTAFTAVNVLELQTELAKLGFESKEIGQATPSILDLAAALDVDLASAAALAGATINGFGLEASETKRVVDVLALSSTTSAQDFAKLTESFSNAAPAASAVGVSVEKTAAILGIIADSAISGSRGGTALKNSFIELEKKGLTLEQALDKISGSSQALSTAIELVGKRGGPALLKLVERQEDIEKLTKELENAGDTIEVAGEKFAGAAAALAAAKLDNLAGDTKKLESAWEGLLLSVEDGSGIFNSLARGAVQLATKGIAKFQNGVEGLSFVFNELKSSTKAWAVGSVTLLDGGLQKLGSYFTIFANKTKLVISEIPFIGKAIDKAEVEKNLQIAQSALASANEKIRKAQAIFNKQLALDNTAFARFNAQQMAKAKGLILDKEKKEAEEKAKKAFEESEEDRKEREAIEAKAEKERIKKEKDRLREFSRFKKELDFQEQETRKEKIERENEEALAKLDSLILTETEKFNLLFDINAKYKNDLRNLELDNAEADREAQNQIDTLEIDRRRTAGENTLALELELLERKRIAELENEELTAKERQAINKKYEAEKARISKISADTEKNLRDDVNNAAIDGAAEVFGIQKEVALAGMIRKAPEAIGDSFKQAAAAYKPPVSIAMGALGAAKTVVPIIKAARDIAKSRFPGGKRGRGGGGSSSVASVAVPPPSTGISSSAITSLAGGSAMMGSDLNSSNAAGAAASNNIMGGTSANIVFSESAYSDFQNQVNFIEGQTTIGG